MVGNDIKVNLLFLGDVGSTITDVAKPEGY